MRSDTMTPKEKKVARARALQRHRDQVDDYLESVRGLYALAVSASWDSARRAMRTGARWCVPRRMSAPREETDLSDLAPGESDSAAEVTPDAVIQVTPGYGVVAEMKKHFPTIDEDAVFGQIAKYDRDLEGWWTPDGHLPVHDLVLVTHMASSVRARDAFQRWQAAGNDFRRAFSIVEFSYMTTGRLWFLLRRVDGKLSDPEHDEALRQGKMIDDSVLLELFRDWKFSEQEPPLMHMLLLLHDYVLPLFPSEYEFEKQSGKRFPVIDVTCEELREKLAQQFCPTQADARHFQLPKASWVRRALDELVRIGLATPLPSQVAAGLIENGGEAARNARFGEQGGPREQEQARFRISMRKPRQKDTIEYFSDKLLQADWDAKSRRPPDQPSLFQRAQTGTTSE